jgi:sigma-E factor negative regulatory protein RseA
LDADNYSSQAVASSVSPVGLVNSLGATSVQASYGTQSVPVLQPATRTAYQELARQRLNKYMQEHAEHAALNSPNGLVPFARVPRIKE